PSRCVFGVTRRRQCGRQAFGRGHAVAVLENLGDLVPIDLAVEPHADPAFVADVRRVEELVRVGVDEGFLRTRARLAPHCDAVGAVVVVVVHGEELVADAKGRFAPSFLLGRLRQCETDLAQPGEGIARRHHSNPGAGCHRLNWVPWSSRHAVLQPEALCCGSSAEPPSSRTCATAARMSATLNHTLGLRALSRCKPPPGVVLATCAYESLASEVNCQPNSRP